MDKQTLANILMYDSMLWRWVPGKENIADDATNCENGLSYRKIGSLEQNSWSMEKSKITETREVECVVHP